MRASQRLASCSSLPTVIMVERWGRGLTISSSMGRVCEDEGWDGLLLLFDMFAVAGNGNLGG